jgi:hypothetical protein
VEKVARLVGLVGSHVLVVLGRDLLCRTAVARVGLGRGDIGMFGFIETARAIWAVV